MPAWPVDLKRSRGLGGIGRRCLPRDVDAESGRDCRVDKAIGGQGSERVRPGDRDLGGVSDFARDEGAIVNVPNQIWT
jgi:hypothetical protein